MFAFLQSYFIIYDSHSLFTCFASYLRSCNHSVYPIRSSTILDWIVSTIYNRDGCSLVQSYLLHRIYDTLFISWLDRIYHLRSWRICIWYLQLQCNLILLSTILHWIVSTIYDSHWFYNHDQDSIIPALTISYYSFFDHRSPPNSNALNANRTFNESNPKLLTSAC